MRQIDLLHSEVGIANQMIGNHHPPFIIAEMSGNHNQSLERALRIVEAAASCGVQALKLQTYTADTMTLNIGSKDFVISDPASLWNGYSLYELYEKAHTPWEWHKAIFSRCAELGLICLSTPFDTTAVDFLESLHCPCYKIASFEITDLQLISYVAATGKPMILSTGMATVAEIDDAVRTARENGCDDIILLKCTSTYPAPPDHSNLATISHMQQLFSCPAGLSDHTLGMGTAIAAVALGASVIEKHFTLDRKDGGVDSAFSLDPEEMRILVKEARQAWQSVGKIQYGAGSVEKASRKFRRSIYASADIKAGETIGEENIRIIRPGYGLEPKFFPVLCGMTARVDIPRGTPIDWVLLKG